MKNLTFKDYIDVVRENIDVLGVYHECLGRGIHPYITQISIALRDLDPFIVFEATIAASFLLSDKAIYH